MKRFLHNFKTNSGSQFRVAVLAVLFSLFANFASAQYTAIPDAQFEQRLIDYNLDPDQTINGSVETIAISGLESLDLSYAGIIDLTGIEAFSNLKDFYCSDNNISGALDLSMLPYLRYVDIQNNALTSLNVFGLTDLVTLVVWNNKLNTLDLSTNPNLIYLDCDDNNLASVDVSGLTSLIDFYCSGNGLTDLDVRGLVNLEFFSCRYNPDLYCILVDNVFVANSLHLANQWEKDGTATYSHCDCDLTTTWTSAGGGSWDNGVPTDGTYAAIIAFDYNQSATINACSLTVNNNAVVTIPSGFNVTLNAPIVVTAGSSFTLSNNANLIQTNKNSINSGNINVKRDSSPLFRLDFTMWSSPVNGTQTLGDFSSLTSSTRFYEYNSTTNLYNALSSSSTFSPSKGYLIRAPNNWVNYVVSPPSTPLSWTGTFIGKPNNGDVSIALSNGAYSAVGNPYASTVNIDQFLAENFGIIDGTLWFWRKKNDASNLTSYSTCTTAGCTLNNSHSYLNENFISVGQGFIVKCTGTGNLKFTNAMRIANNQNQFFKTKKIEKDRIWLNLSMGSNPVNQMLLAYMPGATQGIDHAIDGAYFDDSPTALNSLIDTKEFAVQGRSFPFDATDVVPLAFKTATAGDFTIAIDRTDGLFLESQAIYLLDSKTGIETNLKTNSYTFAAASGVDNARFSLKYQKTLKVDAPSFDENSVSVYKNKGILTVNSKAIPIANVKVFDIQGRLITEQKNVKSNTATVNVSKFAPQVLIVKATGEDNKVVSKKIVN